MGLKVCLSIYKHLLSLLIVISFAMSHAAIQVEGTEWVEPVLVWVAVCMPPGSGKSSMCKLMKGLLNEAYTKTSKGAPCWFLDDQSLER